ncbi:MAG: HAMP domain-containing histidine kinase [Thermomicrobiales bacterium]|nr:HAMP domain-containing histidine kinase [Thermomicrobiales bacterium]
MSIRVRLAAWCIAIFCVLLAAISVVIYEVHSHTHYRDLDQTLAAITAHYQSEIERALAAGAAVDPSLLASLDPTGPGLLETNLAVYDAAGRLVAGQPLAGVAPAGASVNQGEHDAGSFQTIASPAGRVRVHTMPLEARGATMGFIQSRASLAAIDRSMARLRQLLVAAIAGGLLIAAAGSMLTVTRALHPIADVTEAARAIALSRGFGRRLEPIRQRDELGDLVRTFNEMLGSLDAAYQAQRRFVDDAAHELRAPVTSIIGNLEFLERAPDLRAGEQATIAADVRAEAERLGRLVTDLLALARADAGQRVARGNVDLDRVVVDGVRGLRAMAAGVDLGIAALEPVVVAGDPDRLRQLLIILVENAVRYTPAGGRVRVSLRRQDEEAVLAVADTGMGIAPQDLPRIFDRFYRSDRARDRDAGGSGLGLAIAKWIAEAHDGRIEVESEPGVGATFRVWLPMAARPVEFGKRRSDAR